MVFALLPIGAVLRNKALDTLLLFEVTDKGWTAGLLFVAVGALDTDFMATAITAGAVFIFEALDASMGDRVTDKPVAILV